MYLRRVNRAIGAIHDLKAGGTHVKCKLKKKTPIEYRPVTEVSAGDPISTFQARRELHEIQKKLEKKIEEKETAEKMKNIDKF